MLDPAVQASVISVAGEWAKLVFETTKRPSDLTRAKAVSLLRRDFGSAYKEILMAIQIIEKEERKPATKGK